MYRSLGRCPVLLNYPKGFSPQLARSSTLLSVCVSGSTKDMANHCGHRIVPLSLEQASSYAPTMPFDWVSHRRRPRCSRSLAVAWTSRRPCPIKRTHVLLLWLTSPCHCIAIPGPCMQYVVVAFTPTFFRAHTTSVRSNTCNTKWWFCFELLPHALLHFGVSTTLQCNAKTLRCCCLLSTAATLSVPGIPFDRANSFHECPPCRSLFLNISLSSVLAFLHNSATEQ